MNAAPTQESRNVARSLGDWARKNLDEPKPKRRRGPAFETKPRWPGAPKICLEARLPAFATQGDYYHWHERNGPGVHVKRVWLCEFCEHYHADTVAPSPAGDSSGSGRASK